MVSIIGCTLFDIYCYSLQHCLMFDWIYCYCYYW